MTMLKGMNENKKNGISPWETKWHIFGPVPNKGSSLTWPGEVGFSQLPLDGAESIPEKIEILGKEYTAKMIFSSLGKIDFIKMFDGLTGCPICYMLTELDSRKEGFLPVSFGANWGVQWWVNKGLVYESRAGNMGEPDDVVTNQFCAPVHCGRNLFVGKIIAGTADTWSINLGILPVQKSEEVNGISRVEIKKPLYNKPSTTDYAHSGLRIEQRPSPVREKEAENREKVMSSHGVQAHWISVVDPTGTPYRHSEFLPPGPHTAEENRKKLKKQVECIHKNNMSAISWYPGVHSKSTAEKHPDWKSVSFEQKTRDMTRSSDKKEIAGQEDHNLCYNTPYGDALINFVLESLELYGLDGFWFDGTFRSPGKSPGCICKYCRQKFENYSGMDFPEKVDWNEPGFRHWVMWRYTDYMNFWARLSGRVHRDFPQAYIAVNHLHRLCHSWFAGIPLNPYNGNFIAGTESADSPFITAFHSRQQKAYQKQHSEVWMGLHKIFSRTQFWPEQSDPINRYLHHAMCALTAGVMPSFGTPEPAENLTDAYDKLSAVINPRQRFTGGKAVKYAGLHLSQQAETFYFSRFENNVFPHDYWFTVFGMHNILLESQFLTDIVYDDHINHEDIFEYPVFVAPFSIALSDKQISLLEKYIARGGVLVTDRYFGACDQWGVKADPSRVKNILGKNAEPPPQPDASLASSKQKVEIRKLGKGHCLILYGNPGLSFYKNRNSELADSIKLLITEVAPLRVQVSGPRRLNLGMYQQPGRMVLHIQNFIAWSESESFPNPVLCAPESTGNIKVCLNGIKASRIKLPLTSPDRDLKFKNSSGNIEFEVPEIGWGEIVEIEY